MSYDNIIYYTLFKLCVPGMIITVRKEACWSLKMACSHFDITPCDLVQDAFFLLS